MKQLREGKTKTNLKPKSNLKRDMVISPPSALPNNNNNMLVDTLINQLNKWMDDCQNQADYFFERGMTISETSSLAMKAAYMNVKTLIENNINK
jgi:hypothetical protein